MKRCCEKIKNKIKRALINEPNKCDGRVIQLESDKTMLQNHIYEEKKQNRAKQSATEKLKQY